MPGAGRHRRRRARRRRLLVRPRPGAGPGPDVTADGWEGLRSLYAARAPRFLAAALPGLDPAAVRFVPHHVAHAASAALAAPLHDSSVLVLGGRGETASQLAGRCRGGELSVLAAQSLPHSLGLWYEEVTEHLGFRRRSDEYKVMALASYGSPVFLPELRRAVAATGDGGFHVAALEWGGFVKRRRREEPIGPEHADLAASVQRRLEEVLLDLAGWLHRQTGDAAPLSPIPAVRPDPRPAGQPLPHSRRRSRPARHWRRIRWLPAPGPVHSLS